MTARTENDPPGPKTPRATVRGQQAMLDANQALDIAAQYYATGDLASAGTLCNRILERWPNHPVAVNMLGVIAYRQGRNAIAADYFARAISITPTFAEAHYNLGNSWKAMGRLADAIGEYKKTLDLDPGSCDARYNLGNAHKAQGELDEALKHYLLAIELRPDHADAHNNAGNLLKARGQLEDAVAHYREAIASNPEYAAAHYNLGTTLQTLGRTSEAIAPYQKAIQIKPDLVEAHANLGAALRAIGRLEEALHCYRSAADLRPGFAAAHNNLAAIYERINQLELAETSSGRALQIAPDDPDIQFVSGLLQRRRGNMREARRIFEDLADKALSENYAHRRWFELGRILDAQGETASAFSAFSQGNLAQKRSAGAARASADRYRSRISALSATLTPEWVNSWQPAPAESDVAAPVFMVGFPRSGTTLLDQVMDTHPGLQVMEERRVFAVVEAALLEAAGAYPLAIGSLGEADIHKLRALYFKTVDQHFPRNPELRLVDKFPLNIEYLPLIYRLFPDAPVILAARHPCDVVLSNFMQYYQLNDAMANFFTLEDSVRLYAQVMGLWQRCVELLPLKVYRVHYESLVSDFAETVPGLFEFLGLDRDSEFADFHVHAGKKSIINTPSYDQVTQPLYDSAAGRWLRYREQLAPFLDDLRPYIEQLGYSPADNSRA